MTTACVLCSTVFKADTTNENNMYTSFSWILFLSTQLSCNCNMGPKHFLRKNHCCIQFLRSKSFFTVFSISQFALSLLKALSLPNQIHFLQLNVVFTHHRQNKASPNHKLCVKTPISIYNLWPCRCSAIADEYTAYTHSYMKHNKKTYFGVLTMSTE